MVKIYSKDGCAGLQSEKEITPGMRNAVDHDRVKAFLKDTHTHHMIATTESGTIASKLGIEVKDGADILKAVKKLEELHKNFLKLLENICAKDDTDKEAECEEQERMDIEKAKELVESVQEKLKKDGYYLCAYIIAPDNEPDLYMAPISPLGLATHLALHGPYEKPE